MMNNTIRISNLPPSITASQLEVMFEMIGNVKSARLVCDPLTGINQGVGLVEMFTREELENCILHFNGQAKQGKTLNVREDIPHVPKLRKLKVAAGARR